MKSFVAILFTMLLFTLSACSQKKSHTQRVGEPCEGCTAVFESPVPFDKLSYVDTLPDFNEPGPKLMISGVIYKADGKTPAKDVVLFIYHTDQSGNYSNKNNEKGWARQQGYIRGWMKTNERGEYKFYTLLPASYPNSTVVKHIHTIVKETDKNEYSIDSYLFDDDPFLTPEKRKEENTGKAGNGIVKLSNENGILVAHRDIYLGKNILNYPTSSNTGLLSGLAIGANCPAFDPIHLSGIDKEKKACPMCKYGKGQGIMVWFNHKNLEQMKNFVSLLETTMQQRGETNFRVFLVYMNPAYKYNDETGQKILRGKLIKWAEEQQLKKVALLWVPSPVDAETCGIYLINPGAKNTVFVYKKRKVIAKYINMDYTGDAVKQMLEKIDSETI
ncbi:MAG: hypothetical protein QM737_14900 [Ferruginibacter sp.]